MEELQEEKVQEEQPQEKKKRKISPYHGIKAHSNPLADKDFDYPISPSHVDWTKFYPQIPVDKQKVVFADVGCGYGGLLVALSAMFPESQALGMEIRDKVVEYVEQRIEKLRTENSGQYQNISVVKTNAMKYLPNYFAKGQLKKIFFLFPDPHFKKSNHKRRIISAALLSEYAYALEIGGLAYIATDVEELFTWMSSHYEEHPLFQRLSKEEEEADPVVPVILNKTEEGRKVDRANGKKWSAVYRRVTHKQ